MNNNWKYTVKIKHLFEDETTTELIKTLCKELNRQLEIIKNKTQNSNITEDDQDRVFEELEMLIDNFDFLRQFADGTIEKTTWEDYSFYGDFEEQFNGYLEQLYDLADTRVEVRQGGTEKFIAII